MRRDEKLRNSRDFHRVRATGASARSDGLTVYVVRERTGPARLGLAPRSKGAVERNRMRRRLRAAWGEIEAGEGLDVVVAADRDSLGVEFQNLVDHLKGALSRAEGKL